MEVIMRFPGRSLWVLGAIVAVAAPALWAFDLSPSRDAVWAQFRHPVFFADRLLPEGKYLIVHDDEKSAMMEPCLSVYAENDLDEPLAAIHCLRKVRTPSERDKIVWGAVRGDNIREFGYIQFAGEAFAHYAH
jgi:hypothetical protein